MHEIANDDQPPLEDLIRRMKPVDLILIEGFHTHRHPALEVHRPSEGRDLMWRTGSDIVAVAERLEHVRAHDVAPCVGRPKTATQQRLHSIGSLQARLFRHQPTGLVLRSGKQPIKESAGNLPTFQTSDLYGLAHA